MSKQKITGFDGLKNLVYSTSSETMKDIEKSRTKLSNANFVERAPEEVIEKEKATLSDNEAKKERITENLRSLMA